MTAFAQRSIRSKHPSCWGEDGPARVRNLAGTIEWVGESGETERATESFQQRLWNDNHVAAIGQGQINVDAALSDEGFRRWFGAKSIEPLPTSPEAGLPFLTEVYESLRARLEQLLTRRKTPHLKIFRVMAALYPEAMTTVASSGALLKLTRAMGVPESLKPVKCHIRVRSRIDGVLGEPRPDAEHLAIRMCIPWFLYEHFVQITGDRTETVTEPGK